MAREQYQATEKVVQKMTREGLMEENAVTKEISSAPGTVKRQHVPDRFLDPEPGSTSSPEHSGALRFGAGDAGAYRQSSAKAESVQSRRSSAQKRIQRYQDQHRDRSIHRGTTNSQDPSSETISNHARSHQKQRREMIREYSPDITGKEKTQNALPSAKQFEASRNLPEAPSEKTTDGSSPGGSVSETAKPKDTKTHFAEGGAGSLPIAGIAASKGRGKASPKDARALPKTPDGKHERTRLRDGEKRDRPSTDAPKTGRLKFDDGVVMARGVTRMKKASSAVLRQVDAEMRNGQDDNDALKASEDLRDRSLRSSAFRTGKKKEEPKDPKAWRKKRQQRAYGKAIRGERAASVLERDAERGIRSGKNRLRSVIVGDRKDPMAKVFRILLVVLVLIVALTMVGSGLVMGVGSGNGVVLTTYPNSDEDIYAAENAYRRLEQDLETQLTTISLRYPGYQEYHMDLDDIGHDPYQLISYLTTYHWNFTYEDVEEEIESLFSDQYQLEVTPTTRERNGKTISVLDVRLINRGLDTVCRERMDEEQVELYDVLNTTKGNRDYLFNESNTSWGGDGYVNYSVPEEALSDEQFARMLREAEKYLGWPYVWGGSSPSDGGFDCSGYVCWVVNNCGNGWNVGRTTAEGLRRMCAYISPADAKPGDLVFFQGTYNTEGASHVGIYVGNGMMINAGDPIKYADIHSSYWEPHFMQFGRLPGANPGTSSGSSGFTEEDRRLLADCIYWEARGQSFECQCYVGQVILNRVYDRRYPNTIRGVIGQPGQYANGIRSSPEPCYDAADAVLTGQVAMPRNVIYQAQFQQGSGVWKYLEGEYFCYG